MKVGPCAGGGCRSDRQGEKVEVHSRSRSETSSTPEFDFSSVWLGPVVADSARFALGKSDLQKSL